MRGVRQILSDAVVRAGFSRLVEATDDLALDSPNYTNDDTASRHSPPCAVPASSLLPEDKCLYVSQRSEASGR